MTAARTARSKILANDPTTGENYLVDPSVNWSDTGPQGPGYYVPKGNDYQKLEPGRGG